MHEWKIAEAILEELEEMAKNNSMKKIKRVYLSVGRDSHLTEESVRFCLNSLKKADLFEETLFEIKMRDDMKGVIIESVEGET